MNTCRNRILSTLLLIVLFSSGCTPATLVPPTATPAPPTLTPTQTIRSSDTPIPSTDTPAATNTPEPTSTPTPVPPPVIPMVDEGYVVEGGGFSFQAPEG